MQEARIELLQRMPVFGGIRADVLQFLLGVCPIVSVPTNEFFFREHDQADSMCPLEEALDDLVDVQFLADGPLRILRGTAQKVPCVEELAAPYFRFKDAGAEIVLASPRSGG